LRYTNERKKLAADLDGNPAAATACATSAAQLAGIRDNAALPASLRTLAGTMLSLSCVFPAVAGVQLADTKKEDQFSGTAVLSYKDHARSAHLRKLFEGLQGWRLQPRPAGAQRLRAGRRDRQPAPLRAREGRLVRSRRQI
jgi:hypothetical protein